MLWSFTSEGFGFYQHMGSIHNQAEEGLKKVGKTWNSPCGVN